MIEADYRRDMERRGLTPRSIYKMTGQVRSFGRWLEPLQLGYGDATSEDVQVFLDARRIGSRTRYTWISALHGFYRWGVLNGRLERDPTVTISRPKLRRTLPRPMTDSDLAISLDLATPMLRSWLTLAAYAGLRCAEIAGLRSEDILRDAGLIRVLGKGQMERVVPMHPLVAEVLAEHRVPRKGYVFLRPMGGPWPAQQVSRTINLYLADIGVDATAHQARHWFATRTYAACKDLRVVQELLGHQSPSTTSIYTAFSRSDSFAAVQALHHEGG